MWGEVHYPLWYPFILAWTGKKRVLQKEWGIRSTNPIVHSSHSLYPVTSPPPSTRQRFHGEERRGWLGHPGLVLSPCITDVPGYTAQKWLHSCLPAGWLRLALLTEPICHPPSLLNIPHTSRLSQAQRPGRYLQEADIYLEQRGKSSHSMIMRAEALQSYCGLLSASQLLKNDVVRLILKHCALPWIKTATCLCFSFPL